MVKKTKTLDNNEDTPLAGTVPQQIWQAGLGAFAKAQEEGGRVFSKLVKEGSKLQNRKQTLSEEDSPVGRGADGVGKGSWDKLEQVFEDRVARALGSIGVPTRKDIQALNKRLDQLSKEVAALAPAPAASARKARATPAAKASSAVPKPGTESAGSAAPKAAGRKPGPKKSAANAAPSLATPD